jgi:hypothetical protein
MSQAWPNQSLDDAEMREPKGTLVPDQTREEGRDAALPDSQDANKVRILPAVSNLSAQVVYGFGFRA